MSRRRYQRPLPTRVVWDPIIPVPFEAVEYPQPASVVDALAKTIPKMGIPPKVKVKPQPDEIPLYLGQLMKDLYYRNIIIDLSVAHTDEPLGLRDAGIVADTMTVISLTALASFSYRINSPSNDSTTVTTAGWQETEFEIEELYITNAAQPLANAVLRVNWNPVMIRVKPP